MNHPRGININNPNNNNNINPGKKTVDGYKDIFGTITKLLINSNKKSEMKYNYNIIHYDENLINFSENNNYCSKFKLELEGTYYGINNFELFKYICNKIIQKSIYLKNHKKYILISSGSCAKKIFDYCTKIYHNIFL